MVAEHGRPDVPTAQRLHHEADHRNAIRERARTNMEQQEMTVCSFKPHINDVSQYIDLATYRPLHGMMPFLMPHLFSY